MATPRMSVSAVVNTLENYLATNNPSLPEADTTIEHWDVTTNVPMFLFHVHISLEDTSGEELDARMDAFEAFRSETEAREHAATLAAAHPEWPIAVQPRRWSDKQLFDPVVTYGPEP